MQKLSALTQARNLDGSYYTARTLPVLKESGIATLDCIKYFDPKLKTLDAILGTASSYNLKWVLVNDIYYYNILEKHGFQLKWSAETTGDVRFGSVTIWENDDIPPIVTESRSEKGFWSYVWGILPLLLVVAFLITFLGEFKTISKKSFWFISHKKREFPS